MNSKSVFDVKGSVVVAKNGKSINELLGLSISNIFKYIAKNFVYHSIDLQVDALKKCILPLMNEISRKKLQCLVTKIVQKQKNNPEYPYFNHEQREIDKLVYQLYSLSEEDIREVELWYCRRYRNLAKTQGVLEKVQKNAAIS